MSLVLDVTRKKFLQILPGVVLKSGKAHKARSMASSLLEPPSFVSETKKFPEYKKDLLRWSRLTTVSKELQAELVVYRLEGHPSNIKEMIVNQIGDDINKFLAFLESIYNEDDFS